MERSRRAAKALLIINGRPGQESYRQNAGEHDSILLAIKLRWLPARIELRQSYRDRNVVYGIRIGLLEPDVHLDQFVQFERLFPTGLSVTAKAGTRRIASQRICLAR